MTHTNNKQRKHTLSRRAFFAAAPILPFAALAASPAQASMGSGRYLTDKVIGPNYTITPMDADTLLLFRDVERGDFFLDDAFPIGSGFGLMKDSDNAGPLFIKRDVHWVNGYPDGPVFTVRSMGGDFFRTTEGWRWLPYGPEVPPPGTPPHRTVVAPQPGNSDFIDMNENQGKVIRYDCQNGSLFVVLSNPLAGRWGLGNEYRSAANLTIQRVDGNWNTTLTLGASGGSTINGQLYPTIPPHSAVELYSDGNTWRFKSSHGL